MFQALVAGHICVDLIPELHGPATVTPGRLADVGPLRLAPGGCVANTGGALHALGAPTRLTAHIGDDDLGRVLLRLLAMRGLDTRGLRVEAGRTTSYSIVVEAPGEDRVFWHHTGANTSFDGADLEVSGADLLHLGYPSILPALLGDDGAGWGDLLTRARSAALTTSVDLAVVDPASPAARLDWSALLDRTLPLTDVFTPSVEDLASALGRPAEASPAGVSALAGDLVGRGAAVVALSAGPLGLVLRTAGPDRLRAGGRVLAALPPTWAGRELWAPPLPARPLHTTGAGDAATAGLLYGLLAGFDPEDALLCAAGSAALTLSGRTPLPAYAGGEIAALRMDASPPRGWTRGRRGVLRGPDDAVDEAPAS